MDIPYSVCWGSLSLKGNPEARVLDGNHDTKVREDSLRDDHTPAPAVVVGDSHVKEAAEVSTSHCPGHFLQLINSQLNK